MTCIMATYICLNEWQYIIWKDYKNCRCINYYNVWYWNFQCERILYFFNNTDILIFVRLYGYRNSKKLCTTRHLLAANIYIYRVMLYTVAVTTRDVVRKSLSSQLINYAAALQLYAALVKLRKIRTEIRQRHLESVNQGSFPTGFWRHLP